MIYYFISIQKTSTLQHWGRVVMKFKIIKLNTVFNNISVKSSRKQNDQSKGKEFKVNKYFKTTRMPKNRKKYKYIVYNRMAVLNSIFYSYPVGIIYVVYYKPYK